MESVPVNRPLTGHAKVCLNYGPGELASNQRSSQEKVEPDGGEDIQKPTLGEQQKRWEFYIRTK